MKHFPHIRTARAAQAFGDPGAENGGESMARILVAELALHGEIQTQYPVRIGDHVAWLDLLVGCHAFEFDGKVKFKAVADGGVAERSAGEIAWDEKERQRLVCAEGLGMSRIVWDDFWGAGRDRARERLQAEATTTELRLGTTRPAHLDDFAARMRDVRARRLFPSPAV